MHRNRYFNGDRKSYSNGNGGRCHDLFGGFCDLNGYGGNFLQLVAGYGALGYNRSVRNSESDNDNDLHDRWHRQWLYGDDNGNGNGESESGGDGEFPDDLRGQLSHIDGYGRDFLQLVAGHRIIGYDRCFGNGEPGCDNDLYGYRNDHRVYRNGYFDGDGESEPDGCCEFFDDLRRQLRYINSNGGSFLQLVASYGIVGYD